MKKKSPKRPCCRPTPSLVGPEVIRRVRLTNCEAGRIVQTIRILRGALFCITRDLKIQNDACLAITELPPDTMEESLRTLLIQIPNYQGFELCCVEHIYGLRVVDIDIYRKALYDMEAYLATAMPSARLNEDSHLNWIKMAEQCRLIRRKLVVPV